MIVDYGLCNLGSVHRAFEECGATVVVRDRVEDLKAASHIVLPGVGAFGDAMDILNERGWTESLRHAALVDGKPLLGICLGMQLFFTIGHEGGKREGLDLVPGEVRRFGSSVGKLRVPHVGWNEIHATKGSELLRSVPDGTDVYFVHSYHASPENEDDVLLRTPYGDRFVSGIERGNIFGLQFHPEKSGRMGFNLLKNFLNF